MNVCDGMLLWCLRVNVCLGMACFRALVVLVVVFLSGEQDVSIYSVV